MTQEALKHLKAIAEAFGPDAGIELDQKAWAKLHTAIKEALAQTQEPVAKYSDIVSDGGLDPRNTTPPQHEERPVDCERCNRLEEHAYDLIGKLRVANIKLSMQSKACVYCGQLVMEEKK